METAYIIEATNKIFDLLSETLEPKPEELGKIFAISCNTLRRVSAQSEFLRDVRILALRLDSHKSEFKDICENVAHFTYGFCKIEEKVLTAAGVSEKAVRSLLEQAKILRESIAISKFSQDEVQHNIEKLRDESCGIAKDLHKIPLEQRDKLRQKKRARKIAYAISGTAVMVINASPLAVTMGLSAPGSAVSGAFGSGLIGAALAI
jgi:hypothetical protein